MGGHVLLSKVIQMKLTRAQITLPLIEKHLQHKAPKLAAQINKYWAHYNNLNKKEQTESLQRIADYLTLKIRWPWMNDKNINSISRYLAREIREYYK